MSAILEIDKYQRKIISVIFRFLIIGYSVFILSYCNSEFKWYYNAIAIIVYLVVYFFLNNKNMWISILRLINDYLFISYIIYQTGVNFFSLALLFAPVLNTHNHSGEKKSVILYVLPFLSLLLLDDGFNYWYSVAFLLFFSINSFDSLRSKYFRFQQRLNSVIDDFFISESSSNRPYKIYEGIIPILNNSGVLPQVISKIICLKVEGDKFVIVNGSFFVWNFEISDKKEFYSKLNNKTILFNIGISIDGRDSKNNLIHICPLNSHYYCYIFLSENNGNFDQFPYHLFSAKLMKPFFFRLSKVIDADLQQKKNEQLKLTELEEKINYVTNSVNSMHFIRNKLGPVKSYLAMVEDYNRSEDIDRKKKIEPYLTKERQKLNSSIAQILEKADYILKRSNNPFNVYKIELYGIQQLFSEIRRIWNYYFDTENFSLNWEVRKDRVKYDVKYNQIGMELVLTNWISNMSKYNTGLTGVEFKESTDFYNVTFFNTLNCTDIEGTKFVEEFNNTDRAEILVRNSRGLLEVKDFLNQMAIDAEMYLEEGKIYFSLNFKKYKYDENIDN
ncbi:hypothetical protein LX69_03279 [Breznakibacter xylanolyticus]|uniref:Uncharacterized protein n=1 Tax=Breznakibacter xylanolyticus TaxID=990 RepID=A0A2W7MTM3_9BACT|nr:hypothetical protein [Breznakibacter xylanolyticus]PZX10893.1 hypothetical protein LX69_03279 [Breznakibacter xylanolyticus]